MSWIARGVQAGRAANGVTESAAAADTARARLNGAARGTALAAIGSVGLGIDTSVVARSFSGGTSALSVRANLAGSASVAAAAAVLAVGLVIDAADAFAEIRRATRRTCARARPALLRLRANDAAGAAILAVIVQGYATRACAEAALDRIRALAGAIFAGTPRSAIHAAGAAILRIAGQIRATADAHAFGLGTRALARVAALPGQAGLPARAAVRRVVVRNREPAADSAVIHLGVAVVVDAIAAHFRVRQLATRAQLDVRTVVAGETGPIVGRRTGHVAGAGLGAYATLRVHAHAQPRSAVFRLLARLAQHPSPEPRQTSAPARGAAPKREEYRQREKQPQTFGLD